MVLLYFGYFLGNFAGANSCQLSNSSRVFLRPTLLWGRITCRIQTLFACATETGPTTWRHCCTTAPSETGINWGIRNAGCRCGSLKNSKPKNHIHAFLPRTTIIFSLSSLILNMNCTLCVLHQKRNKIPQKTLSLPSLLSREKRLKKKSWKYIGIVLLCCLKQL